MTQHISLSGELVSELVQQAESTEVQPKTIVDAERENIRSLLEELLVEQGLVSAPQRQQVSSEETTEAPQMAQMDAPALVGAEMPSAAPQASLPSFVQVKREEPELADDGTPVPLMTKETEYAGRVLPVDVPKDVEQDTEFLSAVNSTSANLGIPAEDLMRAMSFETGGTFSPSIRNPRGTATGLIQFIESTAEELGTSTEALAGMTRAEQMVYVEKYLSRYSGRMKDFGDIYMAIHLPQAVGEDNDYVIYNNTDLRTKAYKANRELDANDDGKVTKGEAVTRAARGQK